VVNGSSAINTAASQGGYALGVIISSVLVTQHADRLFVDGLRIAGVPPEIVAKVVTALESTATRLMVGRYPELPETVRTLTGVPYANAFTSGMTRMFAQVAFMMFLTAIAMFIGMRRQPPELRCAGPTLRSRRCEYLVQHTWGRRFRIDWGPDRSGSCDGLSEPVVHSWVEDGDVITQHTGT
jgi:hypothetical protein